MAEVETESNGENTEQHAPPGPAEAPAEDRGEDTPAAAEPSTEPPEGA
jgi:hypothetical protein